MLNWIMKVVFADIQEIKEKVKPMEPIWCGLANHGKDEDLVGENI